MAQPGTLDQTFGNNGVVVTSIPGLVEEPRHIALQSDGKILIAGQLEGGALIDFFVARYNTDGSLDNAFGAGGIAQYDIGNGAEDSARDLIPMLNGQIMVVTRALDIVSGDMLAGLTRLNADGSLDMSFGTGGTVLHSITGSDLNPQHVQVQMDGKYLLSGRTDEFQDAELLVMRCNTDGSLDTTYGNGGFVTVGAFNSFDIAANAQLLLSNELLCVGWAFDDVAGDDTRTIWKFDVNGDPVNSFGNAGLVTMMDFTGVDLYRAVVANLTHLFAGGSVTPASNSDMVVNKFDLNGQLDVSFGSAGTVLYDHAGQNDDVQELFLDQNGKVLVAGTVRQATGEEDFGLLRLNADGSLDNSFGTVGVFTYNEVLDDDVETAIVQPDGKVLLLGVTDDGGPNQDIMLVRVNANPSSGVLEHNGTRMSIWPNPASDRLYFNVGGGMDQLRILDQLGAVVLESGVSGDYGQVDVSGLPSGFYIVECSSTSTETRRSVVVSH